MVRKSQKPRSITVVSSDNQVINSIRQQGAKPMPSSDFLTIIERAKKKAIRKKKEHPNLSDNEIDFWMNEFSNGNN